MRKRLTDRDLVAIGANQAVEGLSWEIDELKAEVERLQQELDRRDMWYAWREGLLPTERADYKQCHRWMNKYGVFGGAHTEWGERGRALVEGEP